MSKHSLTTARRRWPRTLGGRVALALSLGALLGGGGAAYAASTGGTVQCAGGVDLLVHADGTWSCAGAAPTPTVSASVSPSGSASPTVSPSASVSPTASTAPATTPPASPSSSSSSSPTPSASTSSGPPAQVNNCMPVPSRCGWPDATNTGVTPGTVLTPRSGNPLVLSAGQTLQNAVVTGCVQIRGPAVTIRNVRIVSTCSYAAIDLEDFTTTGAIIENVEIDMSRLADTTAFTGRLNQRSITGDDFTARKVWWHGGSDCVHYGSRVVIEDSFCDVARIPAGYPGDPHIDGFQSAGGSGVLIRHNTIRNPNGQTSAIINGTTPGVSAAQTNVRILNNLMTGGGWTVYCNAHDAVTVPTVEFRGNRFARGFYTGSDSQGGAFHNRSGQWGPTTGCASVPGASSTVWDEDGSPVAVG